MQERSTFEALSDTETALSIETRLGQHSGELYRDVAVDVVEGRVLLTGSVPRREDRIDAERVAWSGAGVRSLTNEITVADDAGVGAYWRDVRTSTAIRSALVLDGSVAARNINVETVEGVVHLTGLARSAGELERIVAHAQRADGARRVVSHVLLIDDPRRRLGDRQAASGETALR
ncbi:MAG: BON domain-containing protein [Pseudomonadota bacterium]